MDYSSDQVFEGSSTTCLVNVTKDRAKGPKGRRLPQRKSMPAKSSEEDDPNQQMTDLCSPNISSTAEENTGSKSEKESKRIRLPGEVTDHKKDVDISSSSFDNVQQSPGDTDNGDIPEPTRVRPKMGVSLFGQNAALTKELEMKLKAGKAPAARKPPPARSSSFSSPHTNGTTEEKTNSKENNQSKRTSLPTAETDRERFVDICSQRSSATAQTVLQSPADNENEDIQKSRRMDPKQEVSLLGQYADHNKEPEKKPKPEKSSVLNKPPPPRPSNLSNINTKGSVQENSSLKENNESKRIILPTTEIDPEKGVDFSKQRSSPIFQTVQESPGDTENDDIPKPRRVDTKQEGLVNSKYSRVGIRVVRGPDWKWENQDGGEGSVGTVVEDGKSDDSPTTLVVVQWDNGIRKKYRVGLNGAYDLRILDNASTGVRHRHVTCVSCQKEGIFGIRWTCIDCLDYDLCTPCYMAGRHDITHQFLRILTPYSTGSTGTRVPKRDGSVRIQMKGIFPPAKVVRGPDWNWHDQDGGAGKVGRVIAIRQWDSNSDRNAVTVEWSPTNKSYMYRLGQNGKIDVKCVQAAADGFYYKDHLPILGDEIRGMTIEEISNCITDEHKSNQGSISENREAGVNVEDRKFKVSALTKKSIMHLSENFKDLFSKEKFCDLKIKVGDQTFQVHKGILASRSPYFASNLHENDRTFEVKDCDPNVFKDFLYYVYTGEIESTSIETVVDLSETADKFADEVLTDECGRILKKFFAVRKFSDSIAAA